MDDRASPDLEADLTPNPFYHVATELKKLCAFVS